MLNMPNSGVSSSIINCHTNGTVTSYPAIGIFSSGQIDLSDHNLVKSSLPSFNGLTGIGQVSLHLIAVYFVVP
jgi:hypothetical protein